MLRQTLQLFVVLAGVAIAVAAPAQERDWDVQTDARRNAEIVKRYRLLLLKNPDHRLAYRSLITKLGRGPALDPLIDDVRAVAEQRGEAAPWIFLGHLLRDRGRDNESLDAYQRAAELEPANAAAHTALGTAHDAAGRESAADVSFERALELSASKRDQRRLLRKLADLAMMRSDHRRAIAWIGRLVELNPGDYRLRVELAETQLRGHRFDDALHSFQAAYERAGRSGKRRAQMMLDIGNVHWRMNDAVAAEAAYRQALTFVGRASWMRREILMRLVDVARETQALGDIYEEVKREWRAPTYHDAMVLAGLAGELGRADDAKGWLKRAARLDRRAIEPRTRLIAMLDPQRDAPQIEKLYAEIVSLRPDDLGQRLERIEWLFFRGGRAEEALDELARLESELDDDVISLVEIAATYQTFGLPDAALRIHADLQQTHPDHVVHLEAYGELLSRLGRLEDAEDVWQHLFAIDPDGVRARLRVAEIASRLRHYDRAARLLRWVLERRPSLIDARHRLAAVYEAMQDWPGALREWEHLFFEDQVDHASRRVVAIASRTAFIGDAKVTPDPGLLNRWQARYDARKSVRTGVVLVKLQRALGHAFEADQLAERLVARDPTTLPLAEHQPWIELARYLVHQLEDGDPRRAVDLLARIAEHFGDHRASSWRRAVDLALTHGDEQFVSEVVERALDAVPNDAHVQASAGLMWGSRGDHARAIEHLRRAVALGTRSFDVHFDLAFHLKEAGRVAEAREVYLDVVRSGRAGDAVVSAALSAIDLSRRDADVRELVEVAEAARGRLPAQDIYTIVVTAYWHLFVYSDDPKSQFEELGERALPLLVEALQSQTEAEVTHASLLLRLYPSDLIGKTALTVWPKDAAKWSKLMLWTLARTGVDGAERAVLAAIDSDDEEAREVALFAVGYLEAAAGTDRLVAILEDRDADSNDRLIAAAALGRIGSSQAIAALEAFGKTDDAWRQKVALWALGQADNRAAAAALATHLGAKHHSSGQLAGVMLNRAGTHGLRELLNAAWQKDPVRRAVARHGLRTWTPNPVWSEFELWMAEEEGPMGRIWIDPHDLVEAAIDDAARAPAEHPFARSFVGREDVVIELARHYLDGEHQPTALTHLVEVAGEVEQTDDLELAPSLRAIVRGLRPKLRELTQSSQLTTVANAAMLLPVGRNAADAEMVSEAAVKLPPKQSARVLERLSRFPWKKTRKALLDGMRSDEPMRRAACARAAAHTPDAATDREAAKLLVQLVRDEAPQVQEAAIDALGRLKQEDTATMLAEMHRGATPDVQLAIRGALRQMDGEAARKAREQIAVEPTLPICEGDQDNLVDLLQDECAGAVEISDF